MPLSTSRRWYFARERKNTRRYAYLSACRIYTVGFHNNDPLDPYDQMLGVSWVASVALLLSAVWYGANAQGTMEQQVKVEQLALTDPVKAAQEVLKFHGIFSPNLALWAVFNNISGHGDEQVPWGRGAFYRWDPWTIGGTDTGCLLYTSPSPRDS